MRVQFLIPPSFDRSKHPAERSAGCTRIVYPFPNLYELYAASMLRNEGHEVALEDFVYDNRDAAEFERFVSVCKADAFSIWGVNLSIPDDQEAIRIIRKTHPETPVILMGPAPTFFPDKFLCDENIIIVRGEPEVTLAEVAKRLAAGEDWRDVDGIIYLAETKADGEQKDENGDNAGCKRVQRNRPRAILADINTLPFPARDLLGERTYRNPKLKVTPYTTMLTSRNCPFQCIYCVPSSLTFARELDYRHDHGRKPPITKRSIENIETELKLLHEQGYKAIGFVDDNFIWTEGRTLAICKLMKKYGFVWGCQARVDAITEPIARALGESGCKYVDLGVESFNDDILKYIKKGITSDQIYTAINLLKKYKVPVKLNILIGTSPIETKETVRDTIRRAKRLGVDQVMVNIVSPFPGTEFYEQALKNGWIEDDEYRPTNVQRESILNYPHFPAREMEKVLFRENLRFFLSPGFIAKQLVRFRSFTEFKEALKALKIKLFD